MSSNTTKFTGRIKTANSRGFGFIETDLGIDFFFHFTSFHGDWKQLLSRIVNQETLHVEFESDSNSHTGPRAINIRIISQDGD